VRISKKILQRSGIEVKGKWNEDLPPVTIDTRMLSQGGVFWALTGGKSDGHDFVEEAFDKGAAIAAVSKDWADAWAHSFESNTFFVMEDTLLGLQELASEVRDTLGAKVVAVTGSMGKTTTREQIVAGLSTLGKAAGSPGNYNNHIGVPLTILNTDGDEKHLVIEMGANHEEEISLLCEIAKPDTGIIINIAEAHLDGFQGIDGVQRAKGELFDYLSEEGLAVVNLDDERVIQTALDNNYKVGFTLGELPENWYGSIYSGQIVDVDDWCRPTLAVEGMVIKMRLPGRHYASGAMAAYAIAIEAGGEPDAVIKAIEAVEPMEGRGKIVELSEDVEILDESYNANISSIINALESLVRRPGKKIAVLGDVEELGEYSEEEHRRLGSIFLLEEIDRIFFVGQRMAFAAEEAELSGHPGIEQLNADEFERLIQSLHEVIEPGTSILIKGSRTMKLEQVVAQLKQSYVNKGHV